jgi:PKD repeat protein
MWLPSNPLEGWPVQFTDTSAGAPGSWSWDFGDGSTSTRQHPVHTFAAAGLYPVSLTVSTGETSDTITQLVAVALAEGVVPRPENQVSPPDAVVEPETASATDRNGRRVVVWAQSGGRAKALAGNLAVTQQESGIFGRLFDPEDGPLGGTIRIAGEPGSVLPTVSFDGVGNFVVGWQAGEDGIFGRFFDPDGSGLTGTFQVDDADGVMPDSPRVSASASGAFVSVWRQQDPSKQGDDGIFGRFFDPDGTPSTGAIQVGGGDAVSVSEPGVASSASGHAVVVWHQQAHSKQDESGVFGRFFDPGGEPEGPPIAIVGDPMVDAATPQVGADAAGDPVVVWAQDLGQGDGWDIYARLLDADGSFLSDPFVVNTLTAGDQQDPSVGVNPAGDFTVAWSSGEDGIFGRFFDPEGTPLGPEFAMVVSEQGLIPVHPEVSVGGDDTVTVSYTKADASGETQGAFFRSFEVATEPTDCVGDDTTHCLNGERFQVTVHWKDFAGTTGVGQAVPLTDDTGYFWFFDDTNVELMLKVLDGTGINGHFWVFYGALSNVEYSIVVTDTATGSSVTYFNPSGTFASLGDTEALPGTKSGAPRHLARQTPAEPWAGQVETRWLAAPQEACTPGPTALCLNRDRFRVEASWRDFAGTTGNGQAVPLTSDTGYFWFFDDANVELVLKVLDARGINGHFWVFYGALSNVEYTITVTDTATGEVRTYTNPAGEFGSVGDTEAFQVP